MVANARVAVTVVLETAVKGRDGTLRMACLVSDESMAF